MSAVFVDVWEDSALLALVRQRGNSGSAIEVRRQVACLRPESGPSRPRARHGGGQRLLRRRGERPEPPNGDLHDIGRSRAADVGEQANVLKRPLVRVCGRSLGRFMRRSRRVQTPRAPECRVRDLVDALTSTSSVCVA